MEHLLCLGGFFYRCELLLLSKFKKKGGMVMSLQLGMGVLVGLILVDIVVGIAIYFRQIKMAR